MSYYLYSPLLALFINLVLLVLVLRRDHRSSLHRVFAIFLFSMGLWGFTIFSMRSSPGLESALNWERAVIAIGPWTSVFFYHFTLLFSRTKPRIWLVAGAYLLCALLSALAPTGLAVQGMYVASYGYAPVIGVLAYPSILTVYLFVLLGLYTLVRFHKTTDAQEERGRASLIIAGGASALLGGVADISHSFGIPIPPLGIIGNILFGSLATIAILRYHLLDIRIVIRKGLAYTLVSGLVAGIYVLTIFIIGRFFQAQEVSVAFNVLLILAIAIALQPILRLTQKVVDRRFYRERYNQLKALEEFSRETHAVTDFDRLSLSLVSLVKPAMSCCSACLLIPHGRKGDFILSASTGLNLGCPPVSVRGNSPVTRWLKREGKFLSRKDIEIIPKLQATSDKERNTLNQLNMELLVGLKTGDDLAGILLLGQKLSGEAYSRDDKRVLTVVSRQVSAALDNARLYKEVQEALRQLQKTQNQLLRTERLKTIGEVASGVGHDLRNLLTVILGRAQLAHERAHDDGKVKHDLEVIKQAALDGAEVVSRLQNFTKVGDDQNFGVVDMNQLLLDALQMVDLRLSQLREMEGITADIILELHDTEPVTGNLAELRQMLTNILVNAIEAMPGGGRLTAASRQENESVVISIEDTGVGMTRKVSKKIFEPFFTTKGCQGVGLGLSIAYGVAKKHGGDIRVSSELGKGSTFTIKLPATKQTRAGKSVPRKACGVASKAAVLIIDDDKAVREVLSEILESGGYSVDLASHGEEGLALAQRKDYAIVITDLGMPGMSGREVAMAINSAKPSIPIFLVTGWDVQLQPTELICWGVTGVITKPFTKTNILTQIKCAIR